MPAPALAEVILDAGIANTFRIVFALTARFFHQLESGLLLAHERPDDRPWASVSFRILERDLIVDRVRIEQSQAFDDMGSVRMEVPGVIKPVVSIEIGDVDHQRVSIPVPAGVSVVQFDGISQRGALVHINDALHVMVFEKPQDVIVSGRLQDLIGVLLSDTGYAGLRAPCPRVEVLVVIIADSADRSRPELIW